MLRLLVPLLLGLLATRPARAEAPNPRTVAVVYNEEVADSKKLAVHYAKARGIPIENLIGLSLPDSEVISRSDYDTRIKRPLIDTFDRRNYWERRNDADGNLTPYLARIQFLVTIRGVPSRIAGSDTKPEGEDAAGMQERLLQTDAASVDSELTMLGVEGQPIAGQLGNPYYGKDQPFPKAALPILLVGRIDGHSLAVCERMIADALAAEQRGLWGGVVVDIANKHPSADLWLRKIAARFVTLGFPTLVDRFNPTLPRNFPLGDTALYFGWYSGNLNGPFRDPKFRFKPGAIACHLHSFSAAQLRNPNKNWSVGLLARGAAATIGNVHEPFLHLTHNFEILAERLLAGHTLVEAAYMAMPALSWQGVVLGDPLYRPFLHLGGDGEESQADIPFRVLRLAQLEWGDNPQERHAQLRAAAERTGEGVYLEAIGLELAAQKQDARAGAAFREARRLYRDAADQLRMDLLLVMLDREHGRDEAARQLLQRARLNFPGHAGNQAIDAWLRQLGP